MCIRDREKGIRNTYVGPDYLDDDLIKKRSDEILSTIDHNIRKNRIAFPIACFHFQSLSFSRDLSEKGTAIALILLLFALPVISVKRNNLIMYFSASALAGFEIIILLLLQLAAGNMYQLTGLVLASLMSGLALGAGTHLSFLQSLSLRLKSFGFLLFYIFTAISSSFSLQITGIFIPAMRTRIITVPPAYLTGHIFNELTLRQKSDSASGSIYSADLIGSASGFILISIVMVPAFGLTISIISLAMLIFAGIIFGKLQG